MTDSRLMKEVCRDVQIKPTHLKITQNKFKRKVFTADNAMLDISVRGLWNNCENMLFEHKDHTSYISLILIRSFHRSTNMKKRMISTVQPKSD